MQEQNWGFMWNARHNLPLEDLISDNFAASLSYSKLSSTCLSASKFSGSFPESPGNAAEPSNLVKNEVPAKL